MTHSSTCSPRTTPLQSYAVCRPWCVRRQRAYPPTATSSPAIAPHRADFAFRGEPAPEAPGASAFWLVGRRATRASGRVVPRCQVNLVELCAILAQADEERMAAGADAVGHGCLHPIPARGRTQIIPQCPSAAVLTNPERILVRRRSLYSEPEVVRSGSRRGKRQVHPVRGSRRRAIETLNRW